MRNHPILTFCFFLAMSVLWLIRKDLVGVPESTEPVKPKMVELVEVQVRSFQSAKKRVLDLHGEKVVSNSTDTEMQLEPVDGTVTENDKVALRFRGNKGNRRGSKAGELLDLQGKVHAATSENREIFSEEILYYPRNGQLQSPGPATVLTTDTRLTGDQFDTATQLRTGVITGHVTIVSTWVPRSSPASKSHAATASATSTAPTAPVAPQAPRGKQKGREAAKPAAAGKAVHGKPAPRQPAANSKPRRSGRRGR